MPHNKVLPLSNCLNLDRGTGLKIFIFACVRRFELNHFTKIEPRILNDDHFRRT